MMFLNHIVNYFIAPSLVITIPMPETTALCTFTNLDLRLKDDILGDTSGKMNAALLDDVWIDGTPTWKIS